MTRPNNEQYVRRADELELLEQLENLMFSGETASEVDRRAYNAARDKGENGDEFFYVKPRRLSVGGVEVGKQTKDRQHPSKLKTCLRRFRSSSMS